jgi:hypothetical protein
MCSKIDTEGAPGVKAAHSRVRTQFMLTLRVNDLAGAREERQYISHAADSYPERLHNTQSRRTKQMLAFPSNAHKARNDEERRSVGRIEDIGRYLLETKYLVVSHDDVGSGEDRGEGGGEEGQRPL